LSAGHFSNLQRSEPGNNENNNIPHFVLKIGEKIYKMGVWEGSGVPVLYIGRTVSKGYGTQSDWLSLTFPVT
jgi:hypothetical protein